MSVALCASRASALATWLTACRISGSLRQVWPADRPWTSTASLSGCCTTGRAMIRSAIPARPGS
jgi:hypothetical protein